MPLFLPNDEPEQLLQVVQSVNSQRELHLAHAELLSFVFCLCHALHAKSIQVGEFSLLLWSQSQAKLLPNSMKFL